MDDDAPPDSSASAPGEPSAAEPRPSPPPGPGWSGPLWLLAVAALFWGAAGLIRGLRERGPEPAVLEQAEVAETIEAAELAPTEGGAPAVAEPAAPEIRPVIPPAEGWTRGLEPPASVEYEIRRGGTARRVANLFKIFHHEMSELNPGLDLDKQLPPDSEVVVYRRKPGAPSESIGFAGKGSLEGAVPMMEGRGRILKMIPWKSWGTEHTITLLDRVLRQWAERMPGADPILVGNISARDGGPLPPHSSHQSGRDVDLGYPQIRDGKGELQWQEMNDKNLDAEKTWALLQILLETGEVELVYVDHALQKPLHAWALAHRIHDKSRLRELLEYPDPPGARRTVIRHTPGHTDHLHVRFACPRDQKRCETRD